MAPTWLPKGGVWDQHVTKKPTKRRRWDQNGYQNGTQGASETPSGRQSPRMTKKGGSEGLHVGAFWHQNGTKVHQKNMLKKHKHVDPILSLWGPVLASQNEANMRPK